ncbi:MAG: tetratricopeptide repeat protein [Elsteraceae bacterium]
MSASSNAALQEAIAHHAAGRIGAAARGYHALLTQDPQNVAALQNLGVIYEQCGQAEDAARAFERVVELDPSSAPANANLGNALRLCGRLEAAVAAYRRALAIDGEMAMAWNNMGNALLSLGRLEEAASAYREVLSRHPEVGQTRVNLAQALQELKQTDAAAAEYQRVIDGNPDNPLAYVALALLYAAAERDQEAKALFERALALDPNAAFARLNYASSLEALGDIAGAKRERAAALALQRVYAEPCAGPDKRADLLLLSVAGFGNLPADFLADRRRYGRIVLYPEHLPPEGINPPPHDLIFNLIADADVAEHALAGAEAFLAGASKPCLNPPAKIRRTKRHLIPDLLADIPHVLVPRTVTASREALMGVEQNLVRYPLLVRPVGSHGGENLSKVEDHAALQAYLAELPDVEVYLTPFVDYRSADGYFRKYRILFVDRKVFPLHLCIDGKWKVHYYTSLMRENQWMRDEEERLLADIANAFPPPLLAAATSIAERLDLDYAGMDCAITQSGELLVFEANANMLAHLNDPIEMFPYKHRYVPRVGAAFDAMVNRRAVGR